MEFLLDFLKVIITATVCLVPFINCDTSPTRGVRRNAGGSLGWRLSVKHGEKNPIDVPLSSSQCLFLQELIPRCLIIKVGAVEEFVYAAGKLLHSAVPILRGPIPRRYVASSLMRRSKRNFCVAFRIQLKCLSALRIAGLPWQKLHLTIRGLFLLAHRI